jgi:hypothetical protein
MTTPHDDALLKRVNLALEATTGETLIASRTAADHGRYGAWRLVDWRGQITAVNVSIVTLANELGASRAA